MTMMSSQEKVEGAVLVDGMDMSWMQGCPDRETM